MANFDVELNDEVENFTVEFGEIQRITVDDFDKLRNRPSYAGQTMTHETNIPEVPTAVSQLTNDADYQTGSEVESAISTAVGDEKDAREQADAGLSRDIGVVDGKVDAEADARERADTALQGAIDDEETARKNADNGLQGQIDAITSSSDVVDIVGTYAELLQYPTAGLGDKDVIKVLQDETHNDAMSYYRWNKSSSTWSYIGSEGPYYTKSETNTLLGDKQDTLTAGSNVTIQNNTISATDTTYTAGNGLTLTGTEFSADTTVLQPKLTAGDGINISAQNVISADIDPADFFTASETVDGTGSEMTLNNTIQAKIKSVQMDGDTYQQTYSGKNLFDGTGWRSARVSSGYPTPSVSGGTIVASGTNNIKFNASNTYDAVESGFIPVANGQKITFSTSTVKTCNRFFITQYNTSKTRVSTLNSTITVVGTSTFTTTQDGYITVAFGSTTADNGFEFENIQLELGASATSYEPFVGSTSTQITPAPNPDYPQAVQTVTGEQTVTITGENLSQSVTKKINLGKNLFDKNNYNLLEAYWGGTSTEMIAFPGSEVSIYIKAKPNTTYTVSKTLGERFRLATTVALPQGDTPITDKRVNDTASSITITTGPNDKYLSVQLRQASDASTFADVIATLQIEVGSTATSYAPYFTPIELCKIGTYQDYIYQSNGEWYVHKYISSYVLTGSESWSRHASSGAFYDAGNSYRTHGGLVPDSNADLPNIISTHFIQGAYDQVFVSGGKDGICVALDNTSNPRIKVTGITTALDFKTMISEKQPTLYFPLETPTDTKITDATLISELDALADALGYKDKTIITVSATGTNLPAILEVSAYRNSLAGVLGVIGRAEAA